MVVMIIIMIMVIKRYKMYEEVLMIGTYKVLSIALSKRCRSLSAALKSMKCNPVNHLVSYEKSLGSHVWSIGVLSHAPRFIECCGKTMCLQAVDSLMVLPCVSRRDLSSTLKVNPMFHIYLLIIVWELEYKRKICICTISSTTLNSTGIWSFCR